MPLTNDIHVKIPQAVAIDGEGKVVAMAGIGSSQVDSPRIVVVSV